jgi:hypothetical protein
LTRKSISTNAPVVSCDVCGRTLLRGEHADVFLHGGARRMVCDLCTARAVHEGWIREGLDDVQARRIERGRGRSLLGRLGRRRGEDRAAEPVPPSPTPVEADPYSAYEEPVAYDDPEVYGELAPAEPAAAVLPVQPVPDAAPAPDDAPWGPVRERGIHAVPTNAELKVARALEVFNGSPHPRTVAGVSRSLGAPIVAARPSATEGSVVSIVVAWELSWYRYEVDLGDEASGVRVVAQGSELDELPAEDQQPNAAADDRGALHLAG